MVAHLHRNGKKLHFSLAFSQWERLRAYKKREELLGGNPEAEESPHFPGEPCRLLLSLTLLSDSRSVV